MAAAELGATAAPAQRRMEQWLFQSMETIDKNGVCACSRQESRLHKFADHHCFLLTLLHFECLL